MNDDRLERALSDAIADLAGTSSPTYLNDILERTSRTRQRPWWTFPGRYLSMSSTIKFATAAGLAFVLGIGIAPLIMPASDDGGGRPGAAANPSPTPSDSASPAPATPFEGQWLAAKQLPSDVETRSDTYPTQELNRLWRFRTVKMSDPRLDGDVVTSNDLYSYADIGVELYSAVHRIDNENGAWVEKPGFALQFPEDDPSARTTVFVGEGDYQGLIAIMELDWLSGESGLFDVRGIVIDGDVPPAPAPVPVPEPEA